MISLRLNAILALGVAAGLGYLWRVGVLSPLMVRVTDYLNELSAKKREHIARRDTVRGGAHKAIGCVPIDLDERPLAYHKAYVDSLSAPSPPENSGAAKTAVESHPIVPPAVDIEVCRLSKLPTARGDILLLITPSTAYVDPLSAALQAVDLLPARPHTDEPLPGVSLAASDTQPQPDSITNVEPLDADNTTGAMQVFDLAGFYLLEDPLVSASAWLTAQLADQPPGVIESASHGSSQCYDWIEDSFETCWTYFEAAMGPMFVEHECRDEFAEYCEDFEDTFDLLREAKVDALRRVKDTSADHFEICVFWLEESKAALTALNVLTKTCRKRISEAPSKLRGYRYFSERIDDEVEEEAYEEESMGAWPPQFLRLCTVEDMVVLTEQIKDRQSLTNLLETECQSLAPFFQNKK
jgi:hypothetical protein